MEWADYYERFYDWAENTQINRISDLTDFGTASSAEVFEAAQRLFDDKAVIRLIKRLPEVCALPPMKS